MYCTMYCIIEQEARAREQASLGNAEKQKIIMQISAVQTDIRRTLDERYNKIIMQISAV